MIVGISARLKCLATRLTYSGIRECAHEFHALG
jgi:hypothetical protein